MAWRSHGKTNRELVENLKSMFQLFVPNITIIITKNTIKIENGIIQDSRVENALLSVDRGNFIDNEKYVDSPRSIGFGATISAPHMVMVQKLLFDNLCNFFFIACICSRIA